MSTKVGYENVTAQCPMCALPIPLVSIKFTTTGWWHKSVAVSIQGDATDFVVHLWSHESGTLNQMR